VAFAVKEFSFTPVYPVNAVIVMSFSDFRLLLPDDHAKIVFYPAAFRHTMTAIREVLIASRVLVRSHPAGGCRVLPAQTPPSRQAGFQHAALEKIPR
jgi:hypothetical protein